MKQHWLTKVRQEIAALCTPSTTSVSCTRFHSGGHRLVHLRLQYGSHLLRDLHRSGNTFLPCGISKTCENTHAVCHTQMEISKPNSITAQSCMLSQGVETLRSPLPLSWTLLHIPKLMQITLAKVGHSFTSLNSRDQPWQRWDRSGTHRGMLTSVASRRAHAVAELSAAIAAAAPMTAGVHDGCARAASACTALPSACPIALLHAASIACRPRKTLVSQVG